MNSETQEVSEINNPGFKELGEKFLEKGWLVKTNRPTYIEFQSPTNAYDAFEIEIDRTAIFVTVPLKESRYKYCAKFSDYFSASTFAEMHLSDYNP